MLSPSEVSAERRRPKRKPPLLALTEEKAEDHERTYRCQLCKNLYPLDLVHFGPFKRNANGFDHRCRNCSREKDRRLGFNKYHLGKPDTCVHCTKPRYRNRRCFTCWAGQKFNAILSRVNGHIPYKGRIYIGMELSFNSREFIAWAIENPPPAELVKPSIDRIVDHIGYRLTNIQWMETSRNARKGNKDLPDNMQRCTRCRAVLPRTLEFFIRSSQSKSGIGNLCLKHRRVNDSLPGVSK